MEGNASSGGESTTHLQTVNQPVGLHVWYCPSRWLLAHHDTQANIQTLSSHMCLADLNNDGESLLALIDFKQQYAPTDDRRSIIKSPYVCRMRVYRGQQLIYNHFLDDMPSCLIATNISLLQSASGTIDRNTSTSTTSSDQRKTTKISSGASDNNSTNQQQQEQPLLTLTINDDIYFYNKLRPSHKMSLEDDECILDTLVKSEIDAWQMVKQNKVDTETMQELLSGLSQELGNQELTSHSTNFLALDSSETRRQYLIAWKMKRLQNGAGEHILSMDTICCAAARLKYSSCVTRSGDFGQTRESGSFLNNSRWTRIIDIQKDGLLLGTEDRHLLIYELRSIKTRLECHYRLPSVPDHILVERCSPSNFDIKNNLKDLTYKILVSCRNCRIYSIDQLYLVDKKASPCKLKELVALKSNVLDMSWTGLDECSTSASTFSGSSSSSTTTTGAGPTFVVACLDRRVYCFNSGSGQCNWVIELELPITCLVCLPKLKIGADESSLVGVASQANRIDFYVALTGRIVDSIYFSRGDYAIAATYGRFGREDNCLCLVSHLGHLLIFILKRTAKFGHGQCLSSAASYASDTLASCSQILRQSLVNQESSQQNGAGMLATVEQQQQQQLHHQPLKLDKPANLPSAFTLSKLGSSTATDQMLNAMLKLDHKCDQVAAKNALSAHFSRPQLQIPVKGREFVNQILDQSRQSRSMGRTFASHMVKLRERVKATIELQSDFNSNLASSLECGNRVTLSQVVGLGSTYRVSVALRLNVERFVNQYSGQLLGNKSTEHDQTQQQQQQQHQATSQWRLTILICPISNASNNSERRLACQVKPFKKELLVEEDASSICGVKPILETTIDFKLFILGQAAGVEPAQGDTIEVQIQVLANHLSTSKRETLIRQPMFITTINVPAGS